MTYLLFPISYLIGSIPMSFILGKLIKKLDIREHGSGNPGTTNAFRVLGKPLGILVFFLDVTKGGFVILLIQLGLFTDTFHPLFYGLAASLGHVYPIFLRFKGGKAVATSVGAIAFYAPAVALVGMLVYFTTQALTRYVSIASCAGAVALFLATTGVYFIGSVDTMSNVEYLFGEAGRIETPIIILIGTLIILYRHRGNFINIAKGIEPKSGFLQKKTHDKAA